MDRLSVRMALIMEFVEILHLFLLMGVLEADMKQ